MGYRKLVIVEYGVRAMERKIQLNIHAVTQITDEKTNECLISVEPVVQMLDCTAIPKLP